MGEGTTGTKAAMLWQFVENILLVVGGAAEPSEREFVEYQKFCEEKWPQTSPYCLVVSGAAGLNAKQRDWVNKFIKSRKLPAKVAIVTDNVAVRGVVTALSWFNAGTKAFSNAKINDALEYLDVKMGERAGKVVLEVRKMQQAMAPPKVGKTASP